MIDISINKTLKAGHHQLPLDVKLQAEVGSVTAIHGPSGAGKTTFLKMVAGLVAPASGHIKINQEVWFDASIGINLTPQQRRAGFVFQNYALFPNMTVRQHLSYACNDIAWIDELLQIGGLLHLQNSKPEYLSGGQQQRLAILRAISIKPKLLLMDEPFSALDAKMKQEVITALKQLWKRQGSTVFIVTHYKEELKDLASNELWIGA
ncbi:molybdate transport system ATP-binding protein [Mucilaginibacter yixingensis]|uniref:Molybdate transport system ATP-binding protein n=1 Tax=Mucilaginibacter yixingensis TaxID=1295612 RepID=A0A2T5JA78_9SPHI|nr:ATP-binding cassette domain-containing protein [Mucilaginibacter yixingensis]PTQ96972.1 molybdate transport system ATP-binding protein [Mucilaginibacter yixingensis]